MTFLFPGGNVFFFKLYYKYDNIENCVLIITDNNFIINVFSEKVRGIQVLLTLLTMPTDQ